MERLVSFGNKRSYDDFKKQIPTSIQSTFDSLRKFCFTLGDNVVEDVRKHRIVFGKSMAFRWFVDMEPSEDSILIKIQKSRKEPQIKFQVELSEDLEPIKKIIQSAYSSIH